MNFAIFCGSRTFQDRDLIRQDLLTIPGCTVIQGCAKGADQIAGEEAEKLGMDVIEVPADWDSLGRAAGPERNRRMLGMLLHARHLGQEVGVFAYHEDPGLGKGTKDMVRAAKDAGIDVIIRISMVCT